LTAQLSVTAAEKASGFELAEVANPDGRYAGYPPTVQAVVYRLPARHDRIIKIKTQADGLVCYNRQWYGVPIPPTAAARKHMEGSPQEPSWLDAGPLHPDPGVAVSPQTEAILSVFLNRIEPHDPPSAVR
jgi:hypothetical protein